jgi:Schlafen, AlbA_2
MPPKDLFATPFDAITFDVVLEIASSGVEEGTQLELKEALSTRNGQPDRWMADQRRIGGYARDDIAKEIVAFSNAYGGVVIVGIEETDDNPKRSKQVHTPMIPRVVDCAEQLSQSLRGIVDPPLPMLEARGIVGNANGDGVIVLRVPLSPSAPHGFGRPPMAYVRRGANSEPLTMRDMQNMFFERRTRLERVEKRREDQSRAAGEILDKWMHGGLLKPHDQMPFPTENGLLCRCSLVPLEDMAIDNMPDRFLG